MKKYDRRRKYFLVLDCETATLPIVSNYDEQQRKNISISKPLIYDLGWTVIDKNGNVYARKNFLISEIFSVPSIFNTAYYAAKRPLYIEKLNRGEIVLADWKTAAAELVKDMAAVEAVGAYNAMFDFKKAIPFTELYISKLYSNDFNDWMEDQAYICKRIAENVGRGRDENARGFEKNIFRFRGQAYKLFDLWGLSCRHIIKNDYYRNLCIVNGWQTESGKYFKTSAETTYRFVKGESDFEESHTALDDADIESEIFHLIVKKTNGKFEMGIDFFPFQQLGTVTEFMEKISKKIENGG